MSERETTELTDSGGRKIAVQNLSRLERMRLQKALGPALSQNAPYFADAEAAAMVREIDGVPMPRPTSETMLEALITKLGDDGMDAVNVHRIEQMRAAMAKFGMKIDGTQLDQPLDGPAQPAPVPLEQSAPSPSSPA